MISGRGIDRNAGLRYGCDEVFPLSDHADYGELMDIVDRVKPSRVFTLHGFADEFAGDLRHRGLDAWSLTGGNQMEFSMP